MTHTFPLHQRRGFTLIEVMVVTGLLGILAGLAYPSFQGALLKARRVDAVTALVQAQLAQERWRSNSPRYGTAQELRLAARSPLGHYDLVIGEPDGQGVTLTATARGMQAADRDCRVIQLQVSNGVVVHRSGRDTRADNDELANRRCWNL